MALTEGGQAVAQHTAAIDWQHYPRVAADPHARSFIEWEASVNQLKPKSIDAYARNLDRFLEHFQAADPQPVIDADDRDIARVLDGMRQAAPRTKGKEAGANGRHLTGQRLSDSTIAQRIVTYRTFYEYLIGKGIRADPVNPVRRGTAGRHGRPRRGLHRPLTRLPWAPSDDEWRRIVVDVLTQEGRRNRAMVLTAYDAALRREELVSLRVTDIDFERSLITVRAEVSKSGRMRHVPFSGFTDHLLKDYIARDRRLLIDTFGGDPDGAVFLSESTRCPGRPLQVGAFNDVMARLRERLALPRLTPHTLRHQRCTTLKRAGLALDDIALIAGHASVESTRLYLHLAPTDVGARVRHATRAFDEWIEGLLMGGEKRP
jgi:site-specific recombinase XerD